MIEHRGVDRHAVEVRVAVGDRAKPARDRAQLIILQLGRVAPARGTAVGGAEKLKLA